MFAARNMMIAGGAFNPLSLSPALWLSDTGSDASVWSDLSGNSRHATQADATKQPVIISSAQNSRQARRFDGINDFLELSNLGSIIGAGNFSLFIAANPTGSFGSNFRCMLGHSADSPSFYWKLIASNYGFYLGTVKTLGATGTSVPSILEYFRNGNAWTGRLNAVDGETTITNTSAWSATGTYYLGHESVGYYAQDMYEILLFPSFLSTDDRGKVETYLNAKWAIY